MSALQPPGSPTRVFLRNTAILFLGVLAAAFAVGPIEAESTGTLVLVALVLALLNMVVKPLLVFFTLPFMIFTFGLGILLINALLLYLAGQLVPGFVVPTFGAAFLGSLIIGLVSLVVNLLLPPRPKLHVQWSFTSSRALTRSRRSINKGDVIDV